MPDLGVHLRGVERGRGGGEWLTLIASARRHDGQWTAVEDVFDTGEWLPVYNLRIADYHTYFVGCEEWGFSVWAHNICLFHGSRQIIPQGGLSLEAARENRAGGTELDGLYFTSSNVRACGFAPGGTVVRVQVDDAFAIAHAHPNPTDPTITDYVFQTQTEIDYLNGGMEVLPQAQAFARWGA